MIRFPFGRDRDAEADAAQAEDAPEPHAAETSPVDALALEADLDGVARGLSGPTMEQQMRMVEAMLFASDRPLSTVELSGRMPMGSDAAAAVRRVEEAYAARGVQLARVAGKWAFRTAPDLAHLLASERIEERRLSKAGVETLAIIAYHQPVTRAEIEEIRQVGVSKGTIDLLMEIGWVKLGRRRQTPGRPVTFVTSDKFMEHFGLDSLRDLPRLDELRQAGLFEARPPVGFERPGDAADASEADADAALEEDDDDHDDAAARADRERDMLL